MLFEGRLRNCWSVEDGRSRPAVSCTTIDLYHTVCQKCDAEDSFDHLTGCVTLWPPAPSEDPHPAVVFLPELARRADAINPGLPVPRGEAAEGETALSISDASDSDAAGADIGLINWGGGRATEPDT